MWPSDYLYPLFLCWSGTLYEERADAVSYPHNSLEWRLTKDMLC